jgi:hypothetical protein
VWDRRHSRDSRVSRDSRPSRYRTLRRDRPLRRDSRLSRDRRLARARARTPARGLVLGACLLLAGCGLGPGTPPAGVQLTVTRDFGSKTIAEMPVAKLHGSDTVMRMLEANAKVTTRYGGGFVQSIDGIAGGREDGGPADWFYYVNGVEATKGAAATKLDPNDHVWWDYHDWADSSDIPAVVGAFPEPFLDGFGGQKLPVRVECVQPQSPACSTISHELTGYGIPAARGGLELAEYNDVLRVIVGTWPLLRDDPAARQLEAGPKTSGVYARINAAGTSLALLDQTGATARTLGPGSGLVAAVRLSGDPPVWIVTGTDAAGVSAAAQAFQADDLHDDFALAISDDVGIPLPVASP